MQEKKVFNVFLEIFLVVAILGTLSAVAFPNIGKMFNKGKVESRETELRNIRTAVIEMLCESTTGRLQPVGPTADMNQVRTSDTPPLVLADYLQGLDNGSLKLGCTYSFCADGTITQSAYP
jgi:type II secretory pathway pseudopilin PulG